MIGIIDYGAGNTKSVMNALNRIDVNYFLSDRLEKLEKAEKLILPGVGHAKSAMKEIVSRGLSDFIREWKKPILGICLGMQLLADYTEEGDTKCLGILNEKILKFKHKELKIPKMGWNTTIPSKDPLFNKITDEDYFYFVHSYYLPLSAHSIADADYGIKYTASLRKDNFWGVQFHPEKSAKAGSIILENFNKL